MNDFRASTTSARSAEEAYEAEKKRKSTVDEIIGVLKAHDLTVEDAIYYINSCESYLRDAAMFAPLNSIIK